MLLFVLGSGERAMDNRCEEDTNFQNGGGFASSRGPMETSDVKEEEKRCLEWSQACRKHMSSKY